MAQPDVARWSYDELRAKLSEFEEELQRAGLAANSVHTYVDRSERFLRWLVGDYRPSQQVAGGRQSLGPLASVVYDELRSLVPDPEAAITYGTLVSRLPAPWSREVQPDSPELARALGEIVRACRRQKPPLPALSAIVVRSSDKLPGGGYYVIAHPGVARERQQLAWAEEVEQVRATRYPESLA